MFINYGDTELHNQFYLTSGVDFFTRTQVKISFFEFFSKISILGFHDLHSANINMCIAVILSPNLSL